MLNLGPYAKTISALVTGVIGWFAVVTESASANITSSEWIMLATVVGTALGVYGIGNAGASPE